MSSSPYATGGGGVQLEREYAASALASLLLAQPVEGLGDEFTPHRVGLQQEASTPVDDVVIWGSSQGIERSLRMACRRKPTLGKSDESTVKLFTDFVQVVIDSRHALETSELRLGLAVAGPFGPAAELDELSSIARRQPSRLEFEAAVSTPRAYSAAVRKRLKNIDELVAEALKRLSRSEVEPKDVSWVLLRSLYVVQTQFEGDSAPGKTNLVSRLQVLTGASDRADQLRLRLVDIASQAAIRAGVFTRSMLRAKLRPFGPLGPSPDFAIALGQVDLLEAELRRRTRRSLQVPGAEVGFKVDRSKEEKELAEKISALTPGSVVILHGEPDVGKSALALSIVEEVRIRGGTAMVFSLRDLPPSAVNAKSALGLSPSDLLSAFPSSDISLLLVDGAEVVQEAESTILGSLVSAAHAVGMSTIIPVRLDAVSTVREALRGAVQTSPVEFVVDPLSNEEVSAVVEAIPNLSRLGSDPRAIWLLRRVGLVELLLEAIVRDHLAPEMLSSEADVFAIVWHSYIRNGERVVSGVTPDARDTALVDVARSLLTGASAPGGGSTALSSLRSDGLLEPQRRSSMWKAGDSFSSDVIRDFSAARLLINDGLATLTASSGPRWATRAARLYAQARLTHAFTTSAKLADTWVMLRAEFDLLAVAHGPRWKELLWEAVLTAGWAGKALEELTAMLRSDKEERLAAIRCVELRFTEGGLCDPLVGAPVLAWLLTNDMLRGQWGHRDDPLTELMSSWLRAIARMEWMRKDVEPHRSLRGMLRDSVLTSDVSWHDHKQLECLGLLGADTDEATVGVLRDLADTHPHMLWPVVENLDAAALLASRDPLLLADLTEAYYIELPDEGSPYGSTIHDDGIRHHYGGGFNTPLAAWYRGPFLALLRSKLSLGLRVIDRMLEQGARRRVNILPGLDRVNAADEAKDYSLELDLLGLGPRSYVGDSHVWSWYRGSAVGPYACMTALFCLEMVADECVAVGASPRAVSSRLLQHAATLATAGLAYGFLVRHIEKTTDELDGFLAEPAIWNLEFGRAVSEGRLHVQGRDPDNLAGRDRRKWTPREVAMHLVFDAARNGDTQSIQRLKEVGKQLLAAAGGDAAPAHVRQWAAYLDWDKYSVQPQGDGYAIQVHPDEDVVKALESAQAKSAQVFEMYRLMNKYRPKQLTSYRFELAEFTAGDQTKIDIQAARGPVAEIEEGIDLSRTAISGVAGAVVAGVADDRSDLAADVPWAVSVLIDSLLNPFLDDFPSDRSINPDGADRKAALALSRVLLLDFGHLTGGGSRKAAIELERKIENALRAAASSFFVEVRENACESLRHVFYHPCSPMPSGRCRHELAWIAAEQSARTVLLGKESKLGRRQIDPITGDLQRELAAAREADLLLNHITPAAICALDAAQSNSCVKERAELLQERLLDAYGRAACYWAEKNYDWSDEQHAAFASAVLRAAASGETAIVMAVANRLSPSPSALGDYLNALTRVMTYESNLVEPLRRAWPQLMQLGLTRLNQPGTLDDRYDAQALIRNLIPAPRPSTYIGNFDEVLQNARDHWLPIEAVSSQITEWIRYARGRDSCVDALIGFLETQPLAQQVDPGLKWIRGLVVGEDGTARTSGFGLVRWLSDLRDQNLLGPSSLPEYRTVVDALVLSNFGEARALQRRDE